MISRKKVIGISLALTLSFSAFMLVKALLFAPERDVRIKASRESGNNEAQLAAGPESAEEVLPEPSPAAEPEEKININTAGREELESLPGIGPALAEAIISHREEKGLFEHKRDIMEVSGIGQSKFGAISALISVGD